MKQGEVKKNTLIFLALGLALAGVCSAQTAFTGATLHPVSGPEIVDGVMVIDDGKIVGLGANVEIPSGAEVIDLAGRHIYPGFVQPLSKLGLTEVESIRATNDFREMGKINSDLRAEVAVNADSRLLPVAVSGGILTAHVSLLGGDFMGTSAVMALRGWNWEDMTLKSDVGMHLNYPQTLPDSGGGGGDGGDEGDGTQDKALKTINDTLEQARTYQKMRAGGLQVDHDAKLEGLLPVLNGEMPLYIHARERNQIESALDWAAEQGFTQLVLVTGPDIQYVAERLAKDGVPVILDSVQELPTRDWEPYDTPFVAALKLHQAGVSFCIANSEDAGNARNLPFEAAMAAAYGLPKDVALRSVTLSAAEIIGVADRVGSLESGKDASFIVTTGDPLEILTRIERVWLRGVEVDLAEDPQRRLYEKYNNRPRRGE